MRIKKAGLTVVLSLLCGSYSVQADLGVGQIPIIDAPAGTAGLGFGIRGGSSPYRGVDNLASTHSDNDFDLVPLYLYEGQYFFAHGTAAGLHVFRGEYFSADVLARYRFDRLEPDADMYYRGLEQREQTVDAGPRLALNGGWGLLSLSALTDTLDRHNGYELDLSYRYQWRQSRWLFSPFVSYVYQDADLLDYYYGVAESEATSGREAYQAASDEFWRAGINSSYQWSKRMLLFANLAFEQVPETVGDSPLVDEDQLASAMMGFSYMFGNVLDESVARRGSDGEGGQWSWRVHGGYTAEETFHKVHRGYVKRSEDVHTYLGGVTIGKLLQDGRKLDYWGRFSFNRRFENDYQEDFMEYNAYVMAMGTGYSPWSDKELFRYGFGFGVSYAEKVPMVEQVKQAKRDKNTAHFLNYLEAQVDFPMQNLFGDIASEDCYIGFSLIHRSGIFANSDLLGNVAGGSDVLAGHVECKQ